MKRNKQNAASRPRPLKQKVKNLSKVAQTYDLTPFFDNLARPIDRLCRKLGRRFKYFRPRTIDFSIYNVDPNFTRPETSDQRENFIPVRFPVISERLHDPALFDQETLEKRRQLEKLLAARFHFETLAVLDELREAFAPFDLDSDLQFEKEYDEKERERLGRRFMKGVKTALQRCNYNELPRSVVDKLLQLHVPGGLSVVACYDDFVEFHFYYRGLVSNPPVEKKPYRSGGRSVTLKSETLSRVVVLARLKKRKRTPLENFVKILNAAATESGATPSEEQTLPAEFVMETIVVKLFKDVSLENMKTVAPSIRVKLSSFDKFKIGGTGSLSFITAVVKFFLHTALLPFLLLFLMFFGGTFKVLTGLLNRRTRYLQQYGERLYSHMLASNFAAVNMLATSAEEQDVKESVLGYFIALQCDKWTTKQELDDAVEQWLNERFQLFVDFEAQDAVEKLIEKKLLLQREERDGDGKPIMEYRAVPLDEALRILDKDWDDFFQYNV